MVHARYFQLYIHSFVNSLFVKVSEVEAVNLDELVDNLVKDFQEVMKEKRDVSHSMCCMVWYRYL